MSHKIPILELGHDGKVRDTAFVSMHEMDSLVGELEADYDFGLGAMEVSGAHKFLDAGELGKLSLAVKGKLPIAAKVAVGAYKQLTSAKKPVKQAPVRKAIQSVKASGKKPVVLARKKPETAHSAGGPSLTQVYSGLKAQGKILNLLATKRAVTSEHNKLMGQDKFRDDVMSLLKKIDSQCAGDPKGSYFARWNKLKLATGVSVHER